MLGDELVSNGLQTLQEGGALSESTIIKGVIGTAVVEFGPHQTHLLKAQKHVLVAKPEAESIAAELESTAKGSLDKSTSLCLRRRVASLSLGATSCSETACFR